MPRPARPCTRRIASPATPASSAAIRPKIYTRADRKATTPAKLKAQIALCNSELGTGYFPEEEEHLATYLELTYYKFK